MSKFQPAYSAPQTASEPRSLLSGAAVVALREPTPVVKTADATAIDAFVRFGAVDVPGVYVASWRLGDRVHAYVGQSGSSVASRLHDPKFRHVVPPERIVTITGDDDRLTQVQTRVIERTVHLAFVQAGVPVIGQVPAGAVVSAPEYGMLRAFSAAAIRQIQVAGLGLQGLSPRDGLAGPVTEPGVVLETVPQGARFRLDTKAVAAEMIETVRDFVITPGSIIRDPGPDPRTRTMGVLRLELSYAGLLEPTDSGRLRVLRPVRFASVSAATRFVTGHEGASPSQWKRVDDGEPSEPRRVPGVLPLLPVLPTLLLPAGSPVIKENVASDDPDTATKLGGFRHG